MSTTGMSPAAAVIPAPAPDELDWQKGGGLLPVIVQHAVTGAVLMLGYMNREAYAATLATAQATFYSRSRRQLWRKGETSGNTLAVSAIRADCDADTLLLSAQPAGPTCHRGTTSCFGDPPPATLLEELSAVIAQVPVDQRLLVTNHDAFTYFLDAYDITFVGSIIPSFDDNAEPSAAEIDELVANIRSTGVLAVFSEASLSPKAAETIANEAGVTVYSGDDALYGDALGAPGSDGETYLGSQIHNARLILESWGVEPSALPAVLQG